jgi:hypothetical protein
VTQIDPVDEGAIAQPPPSTLALSSSLPAPSPTHATLHSGDPVTHLAAQFVELFNSICSEETQLDSAKELIDALPEEITAIDQCTALAVAQLVFDFLSDLHQQQSAARAIGMQPITRIPREIVAEEDIPYGAVCADLLRDIFDLLDPTEVEKNLQSTLESMARLDAKLENGFSGYPMFLFCDLLHTQR